MILDPQGRVLSRYPRVGRTTPRKVKFRSQHSSHRSSQRSADSAMSSERVVLIHLSSHHRSRGGVRGTPVVELSTRSSASVRLATFQTQVLFGIFLIVGFYHLVLFGLRREDQVALYFGLLSLTIAVRIFSMGLGQSLGLRGTVTDYVWMLRLEYVYPCR